MTTLEAPRDLPRFGGFSAGMIGLELRRMMRNRRTVVFTLIMPAVFFLIFGTSGSYKTERVGGGNLTGYVLVSMAVYGAMLATTAGGAMVSIERAAGWSRQLRLTPLKPVAYIAVKLVLAMIIGAVSVAVAFLVGSFSGAQLPASAWIGCGLLAWICALVFAAFGLFMGYLLPSENVMQILGPILALLAFAGGLFVPLQFLDPAVQTIAKLTPAYGVGELARIPLTHDAFDWVAVVNIAVWLALFVAGAAILFRRDTRRV
jgi:ABC-2 type transport system permease protein